MSIKDQAIAWVRSVAGNHLPHTARNYRVATYLGLTEHNALGGIATLQPTEGKIVDANDVFTLLKESGSRFVVVHNGLLSQPVSVGDKVRMSFYQLRRFDGSLANGSEDAAVGGIRSIALTGAKSIFPVKWEGRYIASENEKFAASFTEIGNPYLRDLITQMEGIPVNDGTRRVVNILIDAGATELRFNDPPEEDSATNPPAIRCKVKTEKHDGLVEIAYDRANDTYTIKLTPTAGEPQILDWVHFDELGNQLIDGIDDGNWRKAKVTVTKPAPKARTVAA